VVLAAPVVVIVAAPVVVAVHLNGNATVGVIDPENLSESSWRRPGAMAPLFEIPGA
jgi:hypothetical protein